MIGFPSPLTAGQPAPIGTRAVLVDETVWMPGRALAERWSRSATVDDAIGALLGDVDPAVRLPVLRCGSCGAPVRQATDVEAVWSRKYRGWPDPVGDCLWCSPEGRARVQGTPATRAAR